MDVTERLREAVARVPNARAAGLVHPVWMRLDPSHWPEWMLGILLVAIPSHAVGLWRVVDRLGPGLRPPMLDSLIFEYIGWYLTTGGRLYVDVWELKPPLAYEVASILSLIAVGNPTAQHWLSVIATIAAAVTTALMAGALVRDLTGDDVAAFTAGVALYVLPAYHWRAAYGFKPKYIVPLAVLAAVYFARRDRHGVAGVAGGVAAGFWQLGVIGPMLALGIAFRRGGWAAARRLGGVVTGVLVLSLLPVLYWGAVEAMITEVLLVPLLVGEDLSTAEQLNLAIRLFGGSVSVALFGAIGVAVAVIRQPRAFWWLAVGTAWFGFQVLFVDLDGAPDLFPLMAFLAVGTGVLLGLEVGHQRAAAVLIAILAIVSVVTMGGFGLGTAQLIEPEPLAYEPDREIALPYDAADRQYLYWDRVRPETCRVFYGGTQHELLQLTGLGYVQETCGDSGPLLDALAARYGFG